MHSPIGSLTYTQRHILEQYTNQKNEIPLANMNLFAAGILFALFALTSTTFAVTHDDNGHVIVACSNNEGCVHGVVTILEIYRVSSICMKLT